MKSTYVMNWRNRTKQKLIAYKGGRCQRCGYDKPVMGAYDFHHKDPSKKSFAISGRSLSFERLKEEADKCLLLCKNCHAEVHWEEGDDRRSSRMEIKATRLLPKDCGKCSSTFQPGRARQKYCTPACSQLGRRKTIRPSKEVLTEEIANFPMTHLGKKYGVSDNAVRKWARAYEIPI